MGVHINPYLLTICIATYNRSQHLEKTLENIVCQTQSFDDVEILIADGNSTDSTESVCLKFAAYHANISYIKFDEKGGVDKDYDLAVKNAKGTYCWLFTDDDLIKDGAIQKIYGLLSSNTDLIVVNSEICDYSLTCVLKKSALDIQATSIINFLNSGRDAFFRLCGTYITFIGSIVIKKSLWTEYPRDIFYGTRFIHVGVISSLHAHTKALVVAEPLIKIRLGNAEWSNISFKVWAELWPKLIWSISGLQDATKKSICPKDPSGNLKFLFWLRAQGSFSKKEFDVFISPKPIFTVKILALVIALLPQSLPRTIYYLYGLIKRDNLLIYQITDGRKSKNQWFSAD